jgi:hypothetical protein
LWLDDRLADIGRGGEVKHRTDLMSFERSRNRIGVSDICPDERPPADEALVPSREIVDHDRSITSPA